MSAPMDPQAERGLIYFVMIVLVLWALIQIGGSVLDILHCQRDDTHVGETEKK